MYWHRFHLRGEPFSLTPDPAFLYLSEVHADAFAGLLVGLQERCGLISMIGEVGTGKTTLVYSLLSSLGPNVHTAYISNPRLSFEGILRNAMRDFGVECEGLSTPDLLDALDRFLIRCAEEGNTAALVIDEAQSLPNETFEDLRLLTNLETYDTKLLQIVLVGQPELDAKLKDPALRHVTNRIAVRCHVNPLTPTEVRGYIQHRLAACGGSTDLFTEAALNVLVRHSLGIPRNINVLAHNAMLFAVGYRHARVQRDDVLDAIREREGEGLVRVEPLRGLGERGLDLSARHRVYAGTFIGASVTAFAMLAFWPPNLEHHETPIVPAVTQRSPAPQSGTEPVATTRQPIPERTAFEARTFVSATEDRRRRTGDSRPALSPPAATTVQNEIASTAEAMAHRGSAPTVAVTTNEFHTVQVTRGTSLSDLMESFYGKYDPRDLPRVQAANPQLHDPDHIVTGQALRLPR